MPGGYSDTIIFIIQWIMDAHSQNDDLVDLVDLVEDFLWADSERAMWSSMFCARLCTP